MHPSRERTVLTALWLGLAALQGTCGIRESRVQNYILAGIGQVVNQRIHILCVVALAQLCYSL